MVRAPQLAVLLLSAIIFTTLDCWDWWLGRFYSFLDAHLQGDHKQGPHAAKPTSIPVGGHANKLRAAEEDGISHIRGQTTVCICKRLGESGRARRLQAIRDGSKWHKCSCWGWELDEGHRRQQNGLGAKVSGGSEARKPHLPAAVDPLAGAPDSNNPSVQKASGDHPSISGGSGSNQKGGLLDDFAYGVKKEPAGVATPGENRVLPEAPAYNHVSADAPTEFPLLSTSPDSETPQERPHKSGLSGDVSKAHFDGASAAFFTVRKHRRSRKKRVYVGRWTDCQCPHCTEVRTQRHRQLFVRVIGRGVDKPSGANGHLAADLNGGPEDGLDWNVRQSAIKVSNGTECKVPGHGGENGVVGKIPNGHFGESAHRNLGKSANWHLGGGENGLWEEKANGQLGGSPNGHLGAVKGPYRRSVDGQISMSSGKRSSRGAKPDLLFIHGYCASSNFWADTVFQHLPPALLKSRRVFAPDLLGTGKSPRPHDCHYTLKDHVEALEAVLAAHDVDTFHVIGHSMGSLMAVVLAARNVSRVVSVTLFSPVYADMDQGDPPCEALLDIWAPGTATRWGRVPRVLWQRTLSSIPRWYLNFARFNTHVLYGQHTVLEKIIPRLLPTLPASFVSDFLRDTWDVQLHMFNNTLVAGGHALDSAYQVLADANVRILVDHGTEDNTCPFEGSEALARKYSNVELRRCEKADHLHVVAGREREVVVEIVEEIVLGERKRRVSGK